MFKSTLLLTIVVSVTVSSPVPQKVLYDQRQEGDWNILTELKNVVVLFIPTTSSSTSTPNPGSLLADFLYRSIPKRSHGKKVEKKAVPGEETMHFIESKTAPYHVDISKSKNHLAKLHPEVPAVVRAEEVVIAKSPSIELVKEEKHHSRVARAFVVTVPHEEKKKEGKKRNKQGSKSMLKLLGAENEQCGPGLARDDEGVCRTVKD